MKKFISLLLCLTLLAWVPSIVKAGNSADATIIDSVSITGITVPCVDAKPDYTSELGGTEYTYDHQLDDDPDTYEGKWWYDETEKLVIKPNETFKQGHVYSLIVLLVTNNGCEFKVDEDNNPLFEVKINHFPANVNKSLTSRFKTCVKYTFSPCSEKNRINEVSVKIDPPKTGEKASFSFFRVFPGNDVTYSADTNSMPNFYNGVSWHDKTTETYLKEGDTFIQGHDYEVMIAIKAENDYYFGTDGSKNLQVKCFVNDQSAYKGFYADANPEERMILCYEFINKNEIVSSISLYDIIEPIVGEHPNYTVLTANDSYWVNGVFWVDVTDGKDVTMKETDVFLEDHTYQIQVWLRTAEGYLFHTDADGCLDISVVMNGYGSDYIPAYSEISAEVFYTFDAVVKDINTDTDTDATIDTEIDILTDTEGIDTEMDTSTDTSTEYDTELDSDKIEVVLGDITGDGKVKMDDVVMLQKAIAKLVTLSEKEIVSADVDFDGKNTMQDVVTIQKYIANLITSFEQI